MSVVCDLPASETGLRGIGGAFFFNDKFESEGSMLNGTVELLGGGGGGATELLWTGWECCARPSDDRLDEFV